MRHAQHRSSAHTTAQFVFARSAIAAALLAITAASGTATAQYAARAQRFPLLTPPEGGFHSTFVPATMRGDVRVRVVVMMAGDSIAQSRAKSLTKKISDSQAQAIEKSVAAQHAAIKPLLEQKGAKV